MTRMDEINRVIKHVYTEPKFVATMEWHHSQPSLAEQLIAAVGRPAVEAYIDGEGWSPEAAATRIEIRMPDPMPDFDWWEPRHDAPWRRQDARNRGESA